jgi:hypothetical protein
MGDMDVIERSNVKQPSLGRDPAKLVFTSPTHSREVQQTEDIHPPIMNHSNKAYVSLMGASRKLQMICHGGILNASYTMQIRKSFPEGLISTPQAMPKSNLGAVSTSNLV